MFSDDIFLYPSLFDFKCVTKEVELMCGWLILEDASPISYVRECNEIRECVF